MGSYSYHPPVAIANYFISKSDYPLSHMQILKLAYMAHGFKLGLTGEPLANELVQAWQYGPVFPSIYDKFKRQPPKRITQLGTGKGDIPITSNFNEYEKDIMDLVYDVYGKLDGWKLSVLTHKKNSPWYAYYYEKEPAGKDFQGVTIPNSVIEKYYKEETLPKLQQASRD